MKLAGYILKVQAEGRYSLTLAELREHITVSDKALMQNLHRLKANNKIAQIRQEFYVIIPPQYSHQGTLPATLFLDDMMKYLRREYYLGLFSAVALYGAGHQQPMETQVVIHKPMLRSITNNKQAISFFSLNNWKKEWIVQKNTESGFVNVSSPELTAFDLIHQHKKIGGLNRSIPILEDLCESLKGSKLAGIANDKAFPTVQRLGYLFELLGEMKFSDALFKVLSKKKTNATPLSLSHIGREGQLNRRWNLIINTELDI